MELLPLATMVLLMMLYYRFYIRIFRMYLIHYMECIYIWPASRRVSLSSHCLIVSLPFLNYNKLLLLFFIIIFCRLHIP